MKGTRELIFLTSVGWFTASNC